MWGQDSMVSIVTRLWAEQQRDCSVPGRGKLFNFSPKCPDPSSYSVDVGHSPWLYSSLDMKLTTHIRLVQWLRMGGAASTLPYMPSRGVHRNIFTFVGWYRDEIMIGRFMISFSHQIVEEWYGHAFLLISIHAVCLHHLTLLQLVTVMDVNDKYKLWTTWA